jgi:hypothetical protein
MSAMLSALGLLRWPLTLWSLAQRRNSLRDISAVRELRPDERLELASHDSRFGRLLTTTALIAASGLAVWGWGSGSIAKARVHGLQRDLDGARQVIAQRTVERDEARRVARDLDAALGAEKSTRGQCEARWATAQATCTRVLGEGARRSETRIRRDAARKRGAVDAITKPQPVADPVPPPAPDPRSLLLAIQSAPDGVSGVSPATPAADPAPELRGRTDPGP